MILDGSLQPELGALADLDALLALRDRAAVWIQDRGAVGWRPRQMPRPRLADRIERGQVFVVRRHGGVVASVTLMDEDVECWGERGRDGLAGYVHLLVRDRRLTPPGTGAALLDWSEGQVAGRGRPLVRLDTSAGNPRLIRYYAERGYTAVGSALHPVTGRPITLLQKRLRGGG